MNANTEGGVHDMDVWKDRIQQDVNELKGGQTQLKTEQDKIKNDVQQLQISDKLQDKEIASLKEALTEIKNDTSWIRRKITGAIITTIITAFVGGLIAILITKIYGG